ncbi:MAG: hypothetical protein P9M14_17480 [Candidatus Alcyoniella australis]|nr:hypothetical protein [Candidatus Alcyoniella australis]
MKFQFKPSMDWLSLLLGRKVRSQQLPALLLIAIMLFYGLSTVYYSPAAPSMDMHESGYAYYPLLLSLQVRELVVDRLDGQADPEAIEELLDKLGQFNRDYRRFNTRGYFAGMFLFYFTVFLVFGKSVVALKMVYVLVQAVIWMMIVLSYLLCVLLYFRTWANVYWYFYPVLELVFLLFALGAGRIFTAARGRWATLLQAVAWLTVIYLLSHTIDEIGDKMRDEATAKPPMHHQIYSRLKRTENLDGMGFVVIARGRCNLAPELTDRNIQLWYSTDEHNYRRMWRLQRWTYMIRLEDLQGPQLKEIQSQLYRGQFRKIAIINLVNNWNKRDVQTLISMLKRDYSFEKQLSFVEPLDEYDLRVNVRFFFRRNDDVDPDALGRILLLTPDCD